MKFGKIIRTLIKIAPVVYPIIKKVINKKAATSGTASKKRTGFRL